MKQLPAQLMRVSKRKLVFLLLTRVCLILSCISPADAQTFVHPGVAFNLADLNQLKANITRENRLAGHIALKDDSHSQPVGRLIRFSTCPLKLCKKHLTT
jgi:hypothetical protein